MVNILQIGRAGKGMCNSKNLFRAHNFIIYINKYKSKNPKKNYPVVAYFFPALPKSCIMEEPPIILMLHCSRCSSQSYRHKIKMYMISFQRSGRRQSKSRKKYRIELSNKNVNTMGFGPIQKLIMIK